MRGNHRPKLCSQLQETAGKFQDRQILEKARELLDKVREAVRIAKRLKAHLSSGWLGAYLDAGGS